MKWKDLSDALFSIVNGGLTWRDWWRAYGEIKLGTHHSTFCHVIYKRRRFCESATGGRRGAAYKRSGRFRTHPQSPASVHFRLVIEAGSVPKSRHFVHSFIRSIGKLIRVDLFIYIRIDSREIRLIGKCDKWTLLKISLWVEWSNYLFNFILN